MNEDNIRNDVITLRSIYSLLNTSGIEILYTDILPNYLSKFHKYGSYNFFPSERPDLANHPPFPVRIRSLLPDTPPHPNVQTSFMDGPYVCIYKNYPNKVFMLWINLRNKDVYSQVPNNRRGWNNRGVGRGWENSVGGFLVLIC